MTLSGTESGVEALSDSELQLYESHTTRGWATVLPPTATQSTAARSSDHVLGRLTRLTIILS